MMRDLPLSKIRGLGGKLGTALTEGCGVTTAGEAAALPLEQLTRHVGDRAAWVHQVRAL